MNFSGALCGQEPSTSEQHIDDPAIIISHTNISLTEFLEGLPYVCSGKSHIDVHIVVEY